MMPTSLEPLVPIVKAIPPLIVPGLAAMLKAWKPSSFLPNVSHEWLATGRGSMHPPGLTDQQAEFLSRLGEAEKERFFLAYQIILNERDGSPPQSRAA